MYREEGGGVGGSVLQWFDYFEGIGNDRIAKSEVGMWGECMGSRLVLMYKRKWGEG